MNRSDLTGKYKVITLWQPYAYLIACGAKTIETRSWGTHYHGPILIHAAKRWSVDVQEDCRGVIEFMAESPHLRGLANQYEKLSGNIPWGKTLGKVMCLANLKDCREMTEAPTEFDGRFGWFGPGRYGWELTDVQPIVPPFALTGRQGLFEVDLIASKEVRK